MKILLLGNKGKIGWELQRSLAPLGDLISKSRAEADLSDTEAIRSIVRRENPEIIVNAAAYTAVDRAETEVSLVRKVNEIAVKALAEESFAIGSLLVHYSTDYVFDGKKNAPYVESDDTSPLSVYGRSKAKGEVAIRQSGCDHMIFRTSWICSVRGWNFAKAILKMAQERETLQVVDDQIGAPTSAETVADVTAHCIRTIQCYQTTKSDFVGTYHLTSLGETSWFEYAKLLVREASKRGMKLRVDANAIQPVSSDLFPSIATRPKNSRLDTSKLRSKFEVLLPDWNQSVERILDELVYQSEIA